MHHFWDMDHTIIDNDCDVSWKQFLIETGRVDPGQQEDIERFYAAYERNELDEEAFLAFQLTEFVGRTPQEMRPLSLEHFEARVRDTVFPAARHLIALLMSHGDEVHLLTATNRVVASPVAEHLLIADVIATELEVASGAYTGRIVDTYCCGPGKLRRLERRCDELGVSLRDLSYYGDSTSDLVVLAAVGNPVATNPMPAVRREAELRGWRILDF